MAKVWYHVWVCVDREVIEEWKDWMQEVHIPQLMQTGCFLSYQCFDYEGSLCSKEERAFVIRYEAASREELDTYFRAHAANLQKAHLTRYEGRFRAERFILTESPSN